MNFNNNQYQQRLQQQQQGQMDWKLQYPESSRVDNVLKLFQTVFNSMSEVARNQPGIQNNLRAKAREYEQSQFNSCVTRELYLLKINEQLQKILNSKQQIGQMGQGQPVNLGATQAQQQINTNIGKQTNIGLNIQQPIANNTRQQQAATAALLNNGNLGFTPEQQKQYMQLQQMSQFNSQLMNQMLQQQQQQPIIQPNPLQQQQTFSKPVQNNNFANPNPFQFQNAAAKKLPPKSPIVTPNLAAPLRPLPTPSLAQVMQKYPSRDPKIVNELLIMEANTNIPTQILEISDSAKKEIIEVVLYL